MSPCRRRRGPLPRSARRTRWRSTLGRRHPTTRRSQRSGSSRGRSSRSHRRRPGCSAVRAGPCRPGSRRRCVMPGMPYFIIQVWPSTPIMNSTNFQDSSRFRVLARIDQVLEPSWTLFLPVDRVLRHGREVPLEQVGVAHLALIPGAVEGHADLAGEERVFLAGEAGRGGHDLVREHALVEPVARLPRRASSVRVHLL